MEIELRGMVMSKFNYRLCLAVFFGLSYLMSVNAEEMKQNKIAAGQLLVADGKTNAVIVVLPEACDSVKLAGRELQSYIQQVTDVNIPIQEKRSADESVINIFVGESTYTKDKGIRVDNLKSDGFRIVAKENWIAIVGRDYAGPVIYGKVNPWLYHETYNPKLKISAFGETGTLFGAYEFLRENCGIRWYMPGPLGTVVPKADKLEVGQLDITKAPDFEYRYPWFCTFSESEDEPMWYRRAGFGGGAPVQIMHSFDEMLKYKDAHPEYFALIGGQRDFTNLSTTISGGNLCLSNAGLLEQWVEDICKYFDTNPGQKLYSIVPNDGMHHICECKECQSQIDPNAAAGGRFSNYVWTFVDKVARNVAKKHPDKYVGSLAYEQYNTPPSRIEKLSPNVAVMICKMRATYYNPENEERSDRRIIEWSKKANVLYTWEYYLQSWRPWRNLPTPFPHIISKDMKALKGISKGEMIQAESWEDGETPTNKMDLPGMQHFNLYVTARCYWDSSLDVDAELAEYFRLFYGPAEQEMKKFWLTAEDYWMNQDRSEKMVGFGGGDPMKIFTPARIKFLTSCLDSAKAKTEAESIYRKRVELIATEFAPAVRNLTNERVVNIPHAIVGDMAGEAIVLDGKIDEPAWKTAGPITFVDKSGNEAQFATNAYVTWDNDYLYMAFENFEPEMAKLYAKATERDQSFAPGLWEEDGIEMFICPDPNNRAACYQLIVNAKGVIWDAALGVTKNVSVDKDWNCGIATCASTLADRWVLEIKMPFKDMGISSPIDGKTIAINMYRNRKCDKSLIYSGWSPTLDSSHFVTNRFGTMTFQKTGSKHEK